MASSGRKLAENETILSDGHVLRYSYYVRNLNIIQSLPYERPFTTTCETLPSSWLLKIVFQQEPSAGTVSCSLTLSRTDDVKIPLMASVSLSLIRGDNPTPFISEKFQKDEILPGEEIKEFIAEVIPNKHMKTTYYEKIDIVAMVVICNCHSRTKEGAPNNVKNPS